VLAHGGPSPLPWGRVVRRPCGDSALPRFADCLRFQHPQPPLWCWCDRRRQLPSLQRSRFNCRSKLRTFSLFPGSTAVPRRSPPGCAILRLLRYGGLLYDFLWCQLFCGVPFWLRLNPFGDDIGALRLRWLWWLAGFGWVGWAPQAVTWPPHPDQRVVLFYAV
jgi:hypothetical protein